MKYEELGAALQKIRLESGLTQMEVADSTYYTAQYISYMECSKKMSLDSLINLLSFYGYELDFVKKEQI